MNIKREKKHIGKVLGTVMFSGVAVLSSGSSSAMPPNPEKVGEAKNCAEAREKLVLAQKGSSLISREENEELLKKAEKNVRDLCS